MKGKEGIRILEAKGAEKEQTATTMVMAIFCARVYDRGFCRLGINVPRSNHRTTSAGA